MHTAKTLSVKPAEQKKSPESGQRLLSILGYKQCFSYAAYAATLAKDWSLVKLFWLGPRPAGLVSVAAQKIRAA